MTDKVTFPTREAAEEAYNVTLRMATAEREAWRGETARLEAELKRLSVRTERQQAELELRWEYAKSVPGLIEQATAACAGEVERLRAQIMDAGRSETRLRTALLRIQQWDMLTAPASHDESWSDLPWLKRLVDDALDSAKHPS